MNTLSTTSKTVRDEVHPELQALIDELIKFVDFSVREGYRDAAAQQVAFDTGLSKARPGQSKHNSIPSRAVHLIPFPAPDPAKALTERFEYTYFAGAVKLMAKVIGIDICWGGDWNSDWRVGDNRFNDLAHYELVNQEGGVV